MVKKHKTGPASYIIYIGLFIALLAVNGLAQFIVADFDASTISTGTYWLKTASGAGSGLGAFIIFALFKRDNRVSRDEQYNTDLKEMEETVRNSVDYDFPVFTELETRELKIEAWKLKVELKIQKWSKRASRRVLRAIRLIEKGDERFLNRNGLFKGHLKRKAMRKMEKLSLLKEQKTPAWIEENIDYVKVKHPTITQGEIINGYAGPSGNTKIIDNNAIGHIMRERVVMILITLSIQALYNGLIIQGAETSIAMWMGMAVQFITIFMNLGFGLNYGNTLFEKLDLNNLSTRRLYILKYLQWKEDKPITSSEKQA